MAHVERVGDETTVVEVNLDSLGVGRGGELNGELGAIRLESLGGDLDVGRTSGVAHEVRRSVDLVAELSDVGVLSGGLEDGLLNGVGSRDQESTVEKEKRDTVVETGNGRLRASGETLALGLVGVVEENLESWVLGNTETLSTLLSTVDKCDGTVSEKGTFNHTTALRHGVHLPGGVGVKRLHATAGWVTGSSDILVRATTADDDIGVPVVGAGKGHHNGATGVGVGTVGTREIRKSADDVAGTDIEDFSRLGYLYEEVAIPHQVEEGVHVVRLVLAKNLHVDGLALRTTVGVEDLIGGVVVLRLGRVKTVERTRGNEDRVISHNLNGGVPASSVELCTGLVPGLAIERSIRSRALEETDTLETITNGGVDEVKRSVTTEGNKATVSKEDTARAEGVGLVSQRGELLSVGVVLRRVGVLAVGKLELGVVLDLVEEDDLAVGHQTSVHSRDTRATLDLNGTRLGGSRGRASLGSGDSRRIDTRTRLATLTTVSSGVTAVSVHGAARSLSPGTADGVAESGTTASVGSLNASRCGWGRADAGRLAKNGLTGGGGGGRTRNSGGGGSSLGGGGILAAVLAAISDKAVTVSGTAVSVRAAASAKSTVGVAGCTTEVLTTATVVTSRDSCSRGGDRCSRSVGATRQATGSAMALG